MAKERYLDTSDDEPTGRYGFVDEFSLFPVLWGGEKDNINTIDHRDETGEHEEAEDGGDSIKKTCSDCIVDLEFRKKKKH